MTEVRGGHLPVEDSDDDLDWTDRELVMGKAFGLWGGGLMEIEDVEEDGVGHWATVTFKEMFPDPDGNIWVEDDIFGQLRCSNRQATYAVCHPRIENWHNGVKDE